MNDDELRLLIRAAIQRHMGNASPDPPGNIRLKADASFQPIAMSFAQYHLQRADGDSMCIIEPAVQCNHCGFCKCHGH